MPQLFARYVLTCLCTLALWSAQAHAEQTDLQGVYAIDVAASDSIDTAIDNGVAEMSFMIRGIARSRIAQTNPRYEHITLSHNGSTISVQFDARKPIEMPIDGHAVPWVREDGGKYDVSAQLSATQLVMLFKADDGQRTNTFVLQPDGKTLRLNVKLESPRLPGPISYVLAYKRQVG